MLTLKKVKEMVKAPVHTKRVPSPKMLLEEGLILLRKEFEHGSHLTVYNSGYVLFSAGNRITRKKMLDTYDRIVAEYKMEHYNPKIDPTIRSKFIEGETVPAIMPHYERNAIHDY